MKIKIYIKTIALALLVLTGCEKDFEEMNKDPFNPTETDLPPVFNSMLASLEREWQPQTQFEYEGSGYACQLTSIYGTSGYLPDNAATDLWNNYYDFMSNSRLFDRLMADYNKDLKLDNMDAQRNIVQAYKTVKMVDIFGDVPYSEAGRAFDGPDYYYPKYDDQKDVYLEMMEMLSTAEAQLVENPGDDYAKYGGYDVLFGDDITKWRKFANSLLLRHALKAVDVEPTLSSYVGDILNGNLPLIEDGEDVKLDPVALNLDIRAPIWAYGGGKVRFSQTLYNAMADDTVETAIFDPRLRLFSEVNSDGSWRPMPLYEPGNETGSPNAENRWENDENAGYYSYSPVNYWMLTGRYFTPELIFTAADVHFLKAEAYAKGVGVGIDMAAAQAEYEAGILSSINYWFTVAKGSRDFADNYAWRDVPVDPTQADIDAMMANPKVAWNDTNALELIYTQRWISHIRQIRQGWNVYRQTQMTPHDDASSFVYNRLVYPTSEHTNNAQNYADQVAKMGSDNEVVKVWWAK